MEKSPENPRRQLGAAQVFFWQRLGAKAATNPELRGSAGIPRVLREHRGQGRECRAAGVGWGEGKSTKINQQQQELDLTPVLEAAPGLSCAH